MTDPWDKQYISLHEWLIFYGHLDVIWLPGIQGIDLKLDNPRGMNMNNSWFPTFD